MGSLMFSQLKHPKLYQAAEDGRPVSNDRNSTAAAGNASGVMARPGENVILRIRQVIVVNSSPESSWFFFRILTAADIAAGWEVGVGAVSMLDLSARPAKEYLTSEVVDVKKTAGGAADNGGEGFANVGLAPMESYTLNLPGRGVELWGDNPGGRPGLVVAHGAQTGLSPGVGLQIHASFLGEEWPINI